VIGLEIKHASAFAIGHMGGWTNIKRLGYIVPHIQIKVVGMQEMRMLIVVMIVIMIVVIVVGKNLTRIVIIHNDIWLLCGPVLGDYLDVSFMIRS
jgi:hypothetical protein